MHIIKNCQSIVIKVGSALVAKPETGRVHHYWMAGLAKDIVALRAEGKHVSIVCSGAVTLGRNMLGLGNHSLSHEQKRAAAACGQNILMRAWQEVFAEDDINVAQLLLTIDDSESRQRYLNARSTLHALLNNGIVPVINENDTVASTELKVGDNDRLGARVAQIVGADTLLLLSDIDGLYTADPSKDDNATLIAHVDDITEKIRNYAAPANSMISTGGMVTKIEAASIATSSGCHTIISRGDVHKPVSALINGARHTVFKAHHTPMSARKEWIAGALSPSGSLYVDEGALQALLSGNSLLPVGIVKVKGTFQQGDAVGIKSSENTIIAKGLTAYHSDELQQITGIQSQDIQNILGYERGDAVVHRDDMVLV